MYESVNPLIRILQNEVIINKLMSETCDFLTNYRKVAFY